MQVQRTRRTGGLACLFTLSPWPIGKSSLYSLFPLLLLLLSLSAVRNSSSYRYTYSCLRHVATLSKHLKQVKLPCRITNLFFTNTLTHTPTITLRQTHSATQLCTVCSHTIKYETKPQFKVNINCFTADVCFAFQIVQGLRCSQTCRRSSTER